MNNSKIWKLEMVAQQLYTLSQSWAHESASIGPFGKGLMVVASEARKLYLTVLEYIESLRKSSSDEYEMSLEEIAERTKLLTLNSTIEAVHTYEEIGRPSLVCADELRQITEQLYWINAPEDTAWRSSDIPEVSFPSSTNRGSFYFLNFRINGIRYCENLCFIREILRLGSPASGELSFRSHKIPYYDLYSKGGTEKGEKRKHILVIGSNIGTAVAAPVDLLNVNDVFVSPVGIRNTSLTPPSPDIDIREMWEAKDGSVVSFIQWPPEALQCKNKGDSR